MPKTYVITAKAENVLRVLQRITSLMTRKRLIIKDMHVSETSLIGESSLCLILQADAETVQWLIKQMGKFVDLSDLELKLSKKKAPQQEQTNHEWEEIYTRIGF